MFSSKRRGLGAAVLAIAAALPACDVTRVEPESDSGMHVAMDAGEPRSDAASDSAVPPPPADAATTGEGGAVEPPPLFPLGPLPVSVCAMSVAAECDGHEDCGEGQVCCGTFNPSPMSFRYESIRCADSCDNDGRHIALCHPGENCGPGQVCRRSLLIGYEFISVCAAPADVPTLATGESVQGEIACGDATCDSDRERCCLRMRYDFADLSAHALEPYCMPSDADDTDCSCDATPPPRVDAGTPDEDAGT